MNEVPFRRLALHYVTGLQFGFIFRTITADGSLQQYAEIRRNAQAKTFFALDFSVCKNTQAEIRKDLQ